MRPSKILLSLTLLLFAVSYVSAHPADKPDVKVKVEMAYMPQVILAPVDGVMVAVDMAMKFSVSGAHGFTPFVVVVGGKYFLPAPDYPYTLHCVLPDIAISKNKLNVNLIDLKPDRAERQKFYFDKNKRLGNMGFSHRQPPKIFNS